VDAEIERVEGSTVHLAVPVDALLPAGELARSAGWSDDRGAPGNRSPRCQSMADL